MIAINSSTVKFCKECLGSHGIHVGSAIVFPLDQTTIAVKKFKTETAIKEGCEEIDYVVNDREVKEGNGSYITEEMKEVLSACRSGNVTCKVIF